MVVSYPCILTYDPDFGFDVYFPDFNKEFGGMSFGRTWQESLCVAKDLLGLMCFSLMADGKVLPDVSMPLCGHGSVVRLIEVDMDEYIRLVKFYHKRGHGSRWRNILSARERYWYSRMERCPI